MKGTIFNIQRFSIHDGPGIRTTVFFKGCSLNCLWCHNPESINIKQQVQYFPQKCIGCMKCIELCPNKAHTIKGTEKEFLRKLCVGCGSCTEICYAEALVISGKSMTVNKVMHEVCKDSSYYSSSKGGVTFSGGEALLQTEFLKALLEECKKSNFHTTIDTAGNVTWECFEKVLPYTDLFLYDIKAFNEEKHVAATGVGNNRILENLKKLSVANVDIWIRIPIVTGVNDTDDEIKSILNFLIGLNNIKLIELIPFHNLGEGKYKSLDLKYMAKDIIPPTDELIRRFMGLFEDRGFLVKRE